MNVVIVGDGFIEEDMKKGGLYEKYVDEVIKAFHSTFPFSLFKDDMNFFVAYMASKERGADDSPKEDNRNTVFNSTYFGLEGVERALVVQNISGIKRILGGVPAYDLVCVIVNDKRVGGSGEVDTGGFIFVVSATKDIGDIAIHEVGHTLGKLADGYEDENVAKARGITHAIHFVNIQAAITIDFDNLGSALKWRRFYNHPVTKDKVGAYEGGLYLSKGMYRPAETCKMRNHYDGICVVCAYELYRKLCKKTARPVIFGEFIKLLK